MKVVSKFIELIQKPIDKCKTVRYNSKGVDGEGYVKSSANIFHG